MLPADKPIVAMASTKMDRADHQLAFYHSLYKTALETITPVYLIQVITHFQNQLWFLANK